MNTLLVIAEVFAGIMNLIAGTKISLDAIEFEEKIWLVPGILFIFTGVCWLILAAGIDIAS